MGTALTTWLLVRPLGQVASFSIIAISLLSFSAYMWQTRTQLRIIISQEYRQKHRYSKETSHADNQKQAEVLTSIHPLYPIPGICQKNEAWQVFQYLWYGWLLYCLGFLFLHKLHHCCISLFRQLDIGFIVSAFLLQLAVTVLYILASSVKEPTILSTASSHIIG